MDEPVHLSWRVAPGALVARGPAPVWSGPSPHRLSGKGCRGGKQLSNANSKEQAILLEGTVVESLKNATFRVKTDNGHEVLAHNSGKMRMHRIRVLPGDRVQVEISPYDLKRGRITYRFK